MKAHFSMLAQYNPWANERLYRAAGALPDDLYRRDAGAYFKSLHGTLNHTIVFDDIQSLTAARWQEDERIIRFVAALAESDFEQPLDYQTLNGAAHRQPCREILAHLFNHQTHHRGQAHGILTILGVAEPPPLDLLIMQRERPTQQ